MSKGLFASLLCPSQSVSEEQLATDINLLTIGQSINALNRRQFLEKIAAAGTGLAAVSLIGISHADVQAATASVADVLNFALNLEYLEANLYAAVTGLTPPTGGPGVTGAPAKLTLDAQTLATAANLYLDEAAHIATLQSAIKGLGGTPITQPAIDLSAGGTVSITTQAQFLTVARQFTAVGNSAYAGAAQLLTSNVMILTTAAQILGAEAQHLGGLNYLCCLQGVVSPAVDAVDYPPVPPNSSFFTVTPATASTGPPSAGPTRNTAQVLGIVYGVSMASTTTPPTGITKGGFFPNGASGNITST